MLNLLARFKIDYDDCIRLPKNLKESSALNFINELNEKIENDARYVIVICDSEGGYISEMNKIVKAIKNSPVPVITVVVKEAASSAAMILAAGTKGLRFGRQRSSVMIHYVNNSHKPFKRLVKYNKRPTISWMKKFCKITNQDDDFWLYNVQLTESKELLMSARVAKQYNIIDHIIR